MIRPNIHRCMGKADKDVTRGIAATQMDTVRREKLIAPLLHHLVRIYVGYTSFQQNLGFGGGNATGETRRKSCDPSES